MKTEKKLSAEEIAFLSQVFDAVEGGKKGRAREIHAYDFTNPSRLSAPNLRALQSIFTSAARLWEDVLSAAVRNEVSVRVSSVQQMTFHSYSESLSDSDTIAAFELRPAGVKVFIDMPVLFTQSAVDLMAGGSGEMWGQYKPLSHSERNVLKCLMDRLSAGLADAWNPVVKSEAACGGLMARTDLEDEESVALVSMIWRIGKSDCYANAAVPVKSLDRLIDKLDRQKWSGGGTSDSGAVAGLLEDVDVSVQVDLGRARVNMRDVLSMEVGDIVRLDRSAETPVDVMIGGKSSFQGRPGLKGRKISVQILNKSEKKRPQAGRRAENMDRSDKNE